jgi:dTDP-4-dehydrorhamnose reductase
VKALVLGSSGFLGSYLGFALPALGWETHGVSRRDVTFFPNNTVVGSAHEITSVLERGGYDVVINAIAIASHERCEEDPAAALEVNATMPGRWAGACAERGMRFVHISTDAVFDGDSSSPYSEEDEPNPTSVYGRSKLEGEREVQAANTDALILRTNFYGWSATGTTGILDFFVAAFSAGRAIAGFTDYRVSSLYMGDLAEALVGLVAHGASGVYHAVASDSASKYDWGIAVATEFGLDHSSMAKGSLSDATHLSDRGRNLALSTAKIEDVLKRPMPTSFSGLTRAGQERATLMDYFGQSAL